MNEEELRRALEEIKKENKSLKNRCYGLSRGIMCLFCPLDCEHRSCDFRNEESEEDE
jgi:hypothetical protein